MAKGTKVQNAAELQPEQVNVTEKGAFALVGLATSLLPLFVFSNIKGMAFFSNIIFIVVVLGAASLVLAETYSRAANAKRIKLNDNNGKESRDLQANAYAVFSVNSLYYVAVFLLSNILPFPVTINYIITAIGSAFAVAYIVRN